MDMKLGSSVIQTIGAILLMIAVSACNNEKTEYVLKVKIRKLAEKEIYDKELVYDAIFDAEELNKDSLRRKSSELFLKGMDLFKNKKKPSEGIRFLRSSILEFPDAKTYYELGNALSTFKNKVDLTEAMAAYEIAEHLNFQPLSYVYLREATVSKMLADFETEEKSYFHERALHYLARAFETGFNDTALIQSNPSLKPLTDEPYFKKIVLKTNQEEQSGPNGLFRLFLASFPGNADQFSIQKDEVAMETNKSSINYEFASFIPEMESSGYGRDVTHDFFYVSKIKGNGNYNAILYSSISFTGQDMQPVYTTLATYDNSGKVISRKLVSCQCSAEKVKSFSYQNGSFELIDYKREWEKPITEVSFEENKVKRYQELQKASFRIDDNGRIINELVPSSYRDSSIMALRR